MIRFKKIAKIVFSEGGNQNRSRALVEDEKIQEIF